MVNKNSGGVSRRGFLLGGSAAAIGCPTLFSGCATSYRANETVQVAAIGCGNRNLINIAGLERAGARFVAFSDCDMRGPAVRTMVGHPGVPFYLDWIEMLDRHDRDIDAVMIGTPDHWHASMAIACLGRGKHVLCEKPLCQSFHEMDEMIAAARANPRCVNMAMNQGHAYDTIRDFREIVEAGMIGEATEAHVWCPVIYSYMDELEELKKTWAVPAELDWERWQGPVPHRAYYPKFVPRTWRRWTMYGGNTLGDWSCHLMDPVFWTFGFGLPETVETKVYGNWDPLVHGVTFPKGVRTTFTYTKRDGRPFKFVWYDGEACADVPVPKDWKGERDMFPAYNTPRLLATRDGMANGAFVYGTKGVIEYGHHGANYLRILPDRTLAKLDAEGARPARKYERITGSSPDEKPYNEFVSAIRSGSPVGSDFVYAGAMTQCSLLGVAALFDPNRRLQFDGATKRFADSSAANARLTLPRVKIC